MEVEAGELRVPGDTGPHYFTAHRSSSTSSWAAKTLLPFGYGSRPSHEALHGKLRPQRSASEACGAVESAWHPEVRPLSAPLGLEAYGEARYVASVDAGAVI